METARGGFPARPQRQPSELVAADSRIYAAVSMHHVFDHREFGFSHDLPDGHGRRAYVEYLRALLDHLSVEKAFLVNQFRNAERGAQSAAQGIAVRLHHEHGRPARRRPGQGARMLLHLAYPTR